MAGSARAPYCGGRERSGRLRGDPHRYRVGPRPISGGSGRHDAGAQHIASGDQTRRLLRRHRSECSVGTHFSDDIVFRDVRCAAWRLRARGTTSTVRERSPRSSREGRAR